MPIGDTYHLQYSGSAVQQILADGEEWHAQIVANKGAIEELTARAEALESLAATLRADADALRADTDSLLQRMTANEKVAAAGVDEARKANEGLKSLKSDIASNVGAPKVMEFSGFTSSVTIGGSSVVVQPTTGAPRWYTRGGYFSMPADGSYDEALYNSVDEGGNRHGLEDRLYRYGNRLYNIAGGVMRLFAPMTVLTEAEYDALTEAGAIENNVLYLIAEE